MERQSEHDSEESRRANPEREPGRTATEAESGAKTVSEDRPEPTRTQDRAEGDPDVIDDALRKPNEGSSEDR